MKATNSLRVQSAKGIPLHAKAGVGGGFNIKGRTVKRPPSAFPPLPPYLEHTAVHEVRPVVPRGQAQQRRQGIQEVGEVGGGVDAQVVVLRAHRETKGNKLSDRQHVSNELSLSED